MRETLVPNGLEIVSLIDEPDLTKIYGTNPVTAIKASYPDAVTKLGESYARFLNEVCCVFSEGDSGQGDSVGPREFLNCTEFVDTVHKAGLQIGRQESKWMDLDPNLPVREWQMVIPYEKDALRIGSIGLRGQEL